MTLNEIEKNLNNEIKIIGTLNRIIFRGSSEDDKIIPAKFFIRNEDGGDELYLFTWKKEVLNEIDKAKTGFEVFEFTGIPSIYNEKLQVKVENAKILNGVVAKPPREIVSDERIENIKNEIIKIRDQYIKTPEFNFLINQLILNNSAFFTRPAASRVHHNQKGGLAVHSLTVCKHALRIAESYPEDEIDFEILTAAALLHDIGKISEYNDDGSRTIIGDLFGHISIGANSIINALSCWDLTGTFFDDIRIQILIHCILSHHGKLEYGSPVLPMTLEALIVHRADETDSQIDSVYGAFDNLKQTEFMTPKLQHTTNNKMFRWRSYGRN